MCKDKDNNKKISASEFAEDTMVNMLLDDVIANLAMLAQNYAFQQKDINDRIAKAEKYLANVEDCDFKVKICNKFDKIKCCVKAANEFLSLVNGNVKKRN